jgi:hypothetical protein
MKVQATLTDEEMKMSPKSFISGPVEEELLAFAQYLQRIDQQPIGSFEREVLRAYLWWKSELGAK